MEGNLNFLDLCNILLFDYTTAFSFLNMIKEKPTESNLVNSCIHQCKELALNYKKEITTYMTYSSELDQLSTKSLEIIKSLIIDLKTYSLELSEYIDSQIQQIETHCETHSEKHGFDSKLLC